MIDKNRPVGKQSDNPMGGRTGSRAEIFAWAMYDWANSAYSTISITILAYYIQSVVFTGKWGPVAWAWGIALSMLVAAVLSPIVGAMADANRSKRKYLAAAALLGSATAITLSLVPPSATWVVISLFVLTSFFFEISLGLYNGFLPEIANHQTMNRVSAWGYALGYLGGALALILALVVKIKGPSLGIDGLGDQLRVGIFIMGAWWGLFSIPTIVILRDRVEGSGQGLSDARLPVARAVKNAVGTVGHTLWNIRRYRMLALFLLGFLFFNDGVQTVISQASTVAIKVLHFESNELIGLILMIQFVALPGALIIGWAAESLGQKPTLLACLTVWLGLVVAAFFIETKLQFWILGVVLALVMGGTQSVSRAIMGVMTPSSQTAEFFGFFNLSGKATSFLGTFLFGAVIGLTDDVRLAVLSLLVFFLLGWTFVAFVNVERGRQQAAE